MKMSKQEVKNTIIGNMRMSTHILLRSMRQQLKLMSRHSSPVWPRQINSGFKYDAEIMFQ